MAGEGTQCWFASHGLVWEVRGRDNLRGERVVSVRPDHSIIYQPEVARHRTKPSILAFRIHTYWAARVRRRPRSMYVSELNRRTTARAHLALSCLVLSCLAIVSFLRLRNKNIETWDIRKLPSRKENDPTHTGPGVATAPPASAAPLRLDHLTCAANSPDFWVEPHGLCVAVYGPPRHSQRFGAKHAFWPWPRGGGAGGVLSCSFGGSSTSTPSPANSSVKAKGGSSGGGSSIRGVEVVVPGVVVDSDYRLCLSTGIKFSDTHLATVLDSSRVLVDEMKVAQVQQAGPAVGEVGVTTVHLSS